MDQQDRDWRRIDKEIARIQRGSEKQCESTNSGHRCVRIAAHVGCHVVMINGGEEMRWGSRVRGRMQAAYPRANGQPVNAKPAPRTVEIIVSSGVEGPSLYVDGLRVAGPKPWGGGTTLHRWTVDAARLREDMSKILPRRAARKGGSA